MHRDIVNQKRQPRRVLRGGGLTGLATSNNDGTIQPQWDGTSPFNNVPPGNLGWNSCPNPVYNSLGSYLPAHFSWAQQQHETVLQLAQMVRTLELGFKQMNSELMALHSVRESWERNGRLQSSPGTSARTGWLIEFTRTSPLFDRALWESTELSWCCSQLNALGFSTQTDSGVRIFVEPELYHGAVSTLKKYNGALCPRYILASEFFLTYIRVALASLPRKAYVQEERADQVTLEDDVCHSNEISTIPEGSTHMSATETLSEKGIRQPPVVTQCSSGQIKRHWETVISKLLTYIRHAELLTWTQLLSNYLVMGEFGDTITWSSCGFGTDIHHCWRLCSRVHARHGGIGGEVPLTYRFERLRCPFCEFVTAGLRQLETHLLTIHFTVSRGYCTFCRRYDLKSPTSVSMHCRALHGTEAGEDQVDFDSNHLPRLLQPPSLLALQSCESWAKEKITSILPLWDSMAFLSDCALEEQEKQINRIVSSQTEAYMADPGAEGWNDALIASGTTAVFEVTVLRYSRMPIWLNDCLLDNPELERISHRDRGARFYVEPWQYAATIEHFEKNSLLLANHIVVSKHWEQSVRETIRRAGERISKRDRGSFKLKSHISICISLSTDLSGS